MSKKIVVGKILGCHGVKGFLKLESYLATPKDIFLYTANLQDEQNNAIAIELQDEHKNGDLLISVNAIKTPEEAKSYTNLLLYLDADLLDRSGEGEYFIEELVGLRAVSEDGRYTGEIIDITDYGAGNTIEIKWDNESMIESLPFLDDYVKEVNMESEEVIIARPEYS